MQLTIKFEKTKLNEFRFYVGCYKPNTFKHFERSFVSVNNLWNRKSFFEINDWIMDSGAFTEVKKHGDFIHSEEEYVEKIEQFKECGNLISACSQDYMCTKRQDETIKRYEKIRSKTKVYILPVLQGDTPQDYLKHLESYKFEPYQYVGVGSLVPKGEGLVTWILDSIKQKRPDLKLHGFGVGYGKLKNKRIMGLLHSSDSMSWSYTARMKGRDPNDWREAKAFETKIRNL